MAIRETRSVALPRPRRLEYDWRDDLPLPAPSGPPIGYSGPDRGSGLSQWLDYARRIAGVDSEPWAADDMPGPGFDAPWAEEFDDPYALTEEQGEILDLMDQYRLSEDEAWVLRERLLQWAEDHQLNDLDAAERHLAETLRLMRTNISEAEADRQAAARVFGRSTSVAVKRPTVTPKRKPVIGKEPEWFTFSPKGDPGPILAALETRGKAPRPS